MNLSIIYGIAAAFALLLAAGYCTLVRKKENRLAYLGCVFLPLFMLMTILKVCRLECKKLWRTVLIAVSTLTFFSAASQGYLPWYYKIDSILLENYS